MNASSPYNPKSKHIVFQISTPRSGSNIIALLFGHCVDKNARSLAMDTSVGIPISSHITDIISQAEAPFKSGIFSAYFKEHGACLDSTQQEEIANLSDKVIIVQRDPSLILESMLRKLVLTDEATAKESRVNAKLKELLADPSQKEKVFEALNADLVVRTQVDVQSNPDIAATILLDYHAKQKGADDWAKLQGHMKDTRDYHLAEDLLRLTHGDDGNPLQNYEKPQQYFSNNPFSFIRDCFQATMQAIETYDKEKLSIVDTTAFRGDQHIVERTAENLGLDALLIPEALAPSMDTAMQARTDTAPIFIGRAMNSTQLDKPFEHPVFPAQLPAFLTQEEGLFWSMVRSYAEAAYSPSYIGPETKAEVTTLLDSTVAKEGGKNIRLMERNPLFSYVAVTRCADMTMNDKRVLKDRIRMQFPGCAAAFDTVDDVARAQDADRQTDGTVNTQLARVKGGGGFARG